MKMKFNSVGWREQNLHKSLKFKWLVETTPKFYKPFFPLLYFNTKKAMDLSFTLIVYCMGMTEVIQSKLKLSQPVLL